MTDTKQPVTAQEAVMFAEAAKTMASTVLNLVNTLYIPGVREDHKLMLNALATEITRKAISIFWTNEDNVKEDKGVTIH